MTDWIEIEKDGLPDFREYGFHTGKQVEIRREDGSELVTKYQGYGLFLAGDDMFDDITHWRPHE